MSPSIGVNLGDSARLTASASLALAPCQHVAVRPVGACKTARMGWDPKIGTNASVKAEEGMKVPDGLMSFASDGRGQPSNEQRALYLGAVAFTYAVWESYVEEVAVELVELAVNELQDHPERVPEGARRVIETGATPWELAVSPGWRGLWVQRVNAMTGGDEEARTWGLNTANLSNVSNIFASLGLNPVPQRIAAPRKVRALMPHPSSISIGPKDGKVDVKNALHMLVEVRGQAVHTGRTKDKLYKNEILWWGAFVRGLIAESDRSAREQMKKIIAG